MENNTSIFSFFNKVSFNKKYSFFSLATFFSCGSIYMVSIAILFKQPTILCLNDMNEPLDNSFECSEIDACSGKFFYFIEQNNNPHSLTTEYELICENSSKKRLALTLIFFGYLSAAILQFIFVIQAAQRKTFLFCGGIGIATSLFLLILFNWLNLDFVYFSAVFFLGGLSLIYVNTYSYIFINENFKEEMIPFATLFLSTIWACFGIMIAILGIIFNGNWKVLVSFCCILCFIFSLVFFKINIDEKETDVNFASRISIEKEEPIENNGLFSTFKDLWPHKQIRLNFLIYTFLWAYMCMVYSVQFVELESVGGSVYFNAIIFCFLELISIFFASIITKKFKCISLINFTVALEGIFLVIFILAPLSLYLATGLQSIFFIFCFTITKLCNALIHLFIYMSLHKMFTEKYIAIFVIISRLLARVLMIFIPAISYLIRSFNMHPFVFYGSGFLILRILLVFCEEVQNEGIEDLLNQTKVRMLERMSIISGSHSLAGSVLPDDILKEIKVNGVQLSVVYKIKTNSEIKIPLMPLKDDFRKRESVGK